MKVHLEFRRLNASLLHGMTHCEPDPLQLSASCSAVLSYSRIEDMERELDRFECEITSSPPDEGTGLAEMAVAALEANYVYGALYSISGKILI